MSSRARTSRAAALMALAALALAACGSRVDGEQALRDAVDPSALADGADLSDASDASGPGAGGEAAAGVGTARSDGSAVGAATGGGPPPAEVVATAPKSSEPAEPLGIVTAVTPRCVERPGTVTVVVETGKLADVTYATTFSDNHHHNQWGLGQADFDGRFTAQIVVGPGVPDGVATVMAAASNTDGESGSGSGQFTVKSAGAC